MSAPLPRRLAAVWFADIVGFSRRASVDEDDALLIVRAFQRACREVVRHHDGRVVKFTGDGALAEFSSADGAVRAACALEPTFRGCAEAGGLDAPPLRLGVHVGEVASGPDGDIYGDGVNVAARLESVAEAGQVVVSADAWKPLRARREFAFDPLGERSLKGIEGERRVFAVTQVDGGSWASIGRSLGERPETARWSDILAELRRRRVVRSVALHAVAAVALMAGLVGLHFAGPVPAWLVRATAAAAIAGLPVTAILAWRYDIGPDGLRRAAVAPGGLPSPDRSQLAAMGLGALLAIVVLGLGVGYLPVGEPPASAVDEAAGGRLAVLYFDDLSEAEDLGFLAEGLTEALIHELADVAGLDVVSRNGVKPYQDVDVPVDSVARALGARTLVQGSVASSGDRLRVNVQLIDGTTGSLLETKTIERSRGELFALQDDLARGVATFLRTRMGEEVRLREMRAGTRNVEAWELVQRAEEVREEASAHLSAEELDARHGPLDHADSLLARAQTLDDGWAEPPARRAWLAYERSRLRLRPAHWIAVGLTHAGRALEVAPDHTGALEARGTLRYWKWLLGVEEDPAQAERLLTDAEADLRAAIETEPDRARAHATLSHLLAARGSTVEALVSARAAYEADAWLSNADVIVWRLFTSAYDLGRADEAGRWCDEGRRRFPADADFVQCRIWLMTMPAASPEPDEAWALLDEVHAIGGIEPGTFEDRWARMGVAAALARAGWADSAAAVAGRARAGAEIDPAGELAYLEAFVRTIAGDRGGAVDRLVSYLEANPGQRAEVAATWWFRALRDDPRFVALTSR